MRDFIEGISCIIAVLGIILFFVVLNYILDKIFSYYYKKKEERFSRKYPNFIRFRDFNYDITSKICKKKSDLRKTKAYIMDSKDKLNYYPKDSEKYNFLLDKISEKQNEVLYIEEEIKCLKDQRLDYAIRHESDVEEIKGYNNSEYRYWKDYIQKIDNNP